MDELNSKKNTDEAEFNEIQEMIKSLTVNKKASMPDGLYLQKKQMKKGNEPSTKLFKKLTSKGDLHLDTRNSPLGSGTHSYLDNSIQFLPQINSPHQMLSQAMTSPSQAVLEKYSRLKKSLKVDTYSMLRER